MERIGGGRSGRVEDRQQNRGTRNGDMDEPSGKRVKGYSRKGQNYVTMG